MIGIAMTTYNGEKYLKEQIDSILNQTVSDFELIVCDDVSSDSTMDILNGYAAKDSRVHVFRNEENLGFLKNFEKAIRICLDRGAEYVALSDQDDIWAENHLEVLAGTMSSGGGGAGAPAIEFRESVTNSGHLSFLPIPLINASQSERIKFFLYGSCLIGGCNMLIHSSVLSLALPFKKEFYVHDYWLSFIGILTDSIYITEIPVTFHRNHSVNVTGKPPLKKKIKRLFDKKNLQGFIIWIPS